MRVGVWAPILLALLALAVVHGQEQDQCFVSVLNRTASVQTNGVWEIPNVPVGTGPVRIRMTCVTTNGLTLSGQSDFVTLGANVINGISTIALGDFSPIPTMIAVAASKTTLSSLGESLQLTVTGTSPDGSAKDLTAGATGTFYTTSNPAVAAVSPDGLVTAVSSGTVMIGVSNEGSLATLLTSVTIGGDTDGDSIPDDYESANGLDPNDPIDALLDRDNDGLTNLQEFQFGTGVNLADSDGDIITDGEEVTLGQDGFITNPLSADSDGDGVRDQLEVTTLSDPTDANSLNLSLALDHIEIVPSSLTLTVNTIIGEASRLLKVEGFLKDGFTLDLTSRETSYSSSDLTIVNFGAAPGEVFAGQNGVATVTALNSGHMAMAIVTVESFGPTALSFVSVPGYANNVKVSGGFAFVASGSAGLVVVDIADPVFPTVVATLDTPGNANDVRVVGNLAFVADGSSGLQVADVSDPLHPRIIGSVDTPGSANDVAVNSEVLVADGSAGLQVISVANPAAPMILGSLDTAGTAKGVAVEGTVAVVADGTGGARVVDVSTPSSPQLLAGVGGFADARDVAIQQGHAFVADSSSVSSLKVVNIATPASPSIVGSTGTGSFLLQDLAVLGRFALGADVFRVNAVPIVDVSNPANPLFRDVVDFAAFRDDNGTGIDVTPSHVFLTAARDILENGVTGDTRLYIGRYLKVEDTFGIAPTISITSPEPGATFIEGSTAMAHAEASDDVAVSSVSFLVDGVAQFTDFAAPYDFDVTVPTGIASFTLGAFATDSAGNVSAMALALVSVIPDPGTTVIGRVVDKDGNAVAGASVTVFDAFTVLTTGDGPFSISGVPTIRGSIVAHASVTVEGLTLSGNSAAFAPVAGDTTDVGTIAVRRIDTVGLIGYWPLDGNADDLSGNGHHGNISGATPTTGKLGGAYTFDGFSGIAVGNLDFSSEQYTVSCWVRTDQAAQFQVWRMCLGKLGPSGGPFELFLGDGRVANGGGNGPDYIVWDGGASVVGLGDPTLNFRDGNWHMITASFTSGSQKIYADGVLAATSSYTGRLPQSSVDVTIGGMRFGSYHHPWVGDVDEVAIYNRVLSDSEVQDLFFATGGP